MMSVGQDAVLLCKVWCDPAEAARTGCYHQGANTSPSVTGSDNCGSVALSSAALVREDVQRSADESARHAVVVPRYQMSSLASEARLSFDPGRASPAESRPLLLALRL